MIAAFAQLTSTDTGIALVGALALFGWIVGIVFAMALFWSRIASTRGRTVSADGRCTCWQLEDAHAATREYLSQNTRLALRLFTGPVPGALPCSVSGTFKGDPTDPYRDLGIGA